MLYISVCAILSYNWQHSRLHSSLHQHQHRHMGNVLHYNIRTATVSLGFSSIITCGTTVIHKVSHSLKHLYLAHYCMFNWSKHFEFTSSFKPVKCTVTWIIALILQMKKQILSYYLAQLTCNY